MAKLLFSFSAQIVLVGVQVNFFARFENSWQNNWPHQAKKKVHQTQNLHQNQKEPESQAPPLAKIGDCPHHGGESPSSNQTFKEKRLHQHIIYPLGSALARAIFHWCHPPIAVASTSQKTAKKAQQ
jgi:hypothetical protein